MLEGEVQRTAIDCLRRSIYSHCSSFGLVRDEVFAQKIQELLSLEVKGVLFLQPFYFKFGLLWREDYVDLVA